MSGRGAVVAIVVAVCTLSGAACGVAGDDQADIELRSASDETVLRSDAIADDGSESGTSSAQPVEAGEPSGSPVDALARFDLPRVPPIVLPDLSVLSNTGEVVESQLGELAGTGTGLDVVGASCAADSGELVYQGSEAGTFFDVATDGSGSYSDRSGTNQIDITVEADGSGTYSDRSGTNQIDITVEADGSGTYSDRSGTNQIDITVEADGTGTYSDRSGTNQIDMTMGPDGALHVSDRSGTNQIDLSIEPDGSGAYSDWSGTNQIDITVEPDGSGTYSDHSGTNRIESEFTTDIGILDPAILAVGPMPVFVVADRFPPLATLGSLSPPCATVIRVDADALFDFDSDQLRPEAADVVAQVAEALQGTDVAIEVDGHTDSIGDDAYNLDLAARRADNFAAALVSAGVTNPIETVSYGETRPVAPNERADGSDNPAGRQQNRRIEVVIPE